MSELKQTDSFDALYGGHPPRVDSPAYRLTRKWLMRETAGGCYVCGGPPDLSHPDVPADAQGLEDHHGGGIYLRLNSVDILVGFQLAPLEWAGGWAADPGRVQHFAELLHAVEEMLRDDEVQAPLIASTDDVMAWVDSNQNANVKLCQAHHLGPSDAHTPDANGNEAVGIHHCPFPVWCLQATNDWKTHDLWGGTTGTIALAKPRQDGSALVLHADRLHHPDLQSGAVLPALHPLVQASRREV